MKISEGPGSVAEEEEESEANWHLYSVKDKELPKASSLDLSLHKFQVVAAE